MHLDSIKNGASSSLYLQVTGTPQSIFLQTQTSGWHPLFTYYFQPGVGYLGGDFFFPKVGKPDCISYIEELKTPVREVVLRHLLVSAQLLLSGEDVSNCLIHPSSRQATHQNFANKINNELTWCLNNLSGEFETELKRIYVSLNPSKNIKLDFAMLLDYAKNIISHKQAKIIIMEFSSCISHSNMTNEGIKGLPA